MPSCCTCLSRSSTSLPARISTECISPSTGGPFSYVWVPVRSITTDTNGTTIRFFRRRKSRRMYKIHLLQTNLFRTQSAQGSISDAACVAGLSALDLGKQYVLKTEKAMEHTGFLKQFYLCKKEKEFFHNEADVARKRRYETTSDFRNRNRSGKYIEEFLYE